jgi:hypothetical protein
LQLQIEKPVAHRHRHGRTVECIGDRTRKVVEAGGRADHLAAAAVGEQPQSPVERGLAGAVGAGDDRELSKRQYDLAQRAVAADGNGGEHGWVSTRLPED